MWTGERSYSLTLDHGWKKTFICIYLGATYSCFEVWQNDCAEIISLYQRNRTSPSYVSVTNAERLRGNVAKNQIALVIFMGFCASIILNPEPSPFPSLATCFLSKN